ncbi:acyltransferase [Paraflavisolibacter sp. H34]|uniref:acyltransferase family protein n=1 Tax=Huijunlia imazamoxiresistens TaxID=3127457 RepID=UPI00301AA0A2
MQKKLNYIDALRGLAILMVIAIHTMQYGTNNNHPIIIALFKSGARGVQLFFVASAFTLFLSGWNRKGELHPTRNFFIRRFFRIAPVYYLGIAYYFWQFNGEVNHWLGGPHEIETGNIISNFLFLHGFNPNWFNSLVPGGWSITVEMMFYCLVPVLLKYISSLNKAITFFVGTVVLNFLLTRMLGHFNSGFTEKIWSQYIGLYLPSQLPVFACGIIAFFIVVKRDYAVSAGNLLAVSLLIAANIILGAMISPVMFFGIAFSLLLVALSRNDFTFLVNPFFTFFGRISYSAYIVHFGILHWMTKFSFVDFVPANSFPFALANYCIRFFVVLGLVALIASLIFRFVEQPMQRMGKWLINRLELQRVSLNPVLQNRQQ